MVVTPPWPRDGRDSFDFKQETATSNMLSVFTVAEMNFCCIHSCSKLGINMT